MKKLPTLLFTIYFTIVVNQGVLAAIDPYSFYPSQVYKPKGEFFRPARELIDRNPLRPLVITDKNGNKTYMSAQGEVMVSVDNQGNKTFSIKGKRSHRRDSKNKLTQQWDREAGSNMVTTRNEFGEVTGKEEYGLGGKMIAEYDAEDNKTKSFQYNKYGKQVEWVIDELTQSRVRYGDDGKPAYDIDFEGHTIATYKYDAAGFLNYREDIYGNRTFFDKSGNRTKTLAKEGYLMATYEYGKDANGYFEVKSVKDEMTGNITLYKDGQQYETRNNMDVVITTYKWQGTKLIFSENGTGEVTWYKNGRQAYVTFEGDMINEWVYHDGKLMGVWDERKQNLLLYSHGRKEMELGYDAMPDEVEILKLYEKYGLEI
jgi:hypothetical protein